MLAISGIFKRIMGRSSAAKPEDIFALANIKKPFTQNDIEEFVSANFYSFCKPLHEIKKLSMDFEFDLLKSIARRELGFNDSVQYLSEADKMILSKLNHFYLNYRTPSRPRKNGYTSSVFR
jgi:hypothetical protein